MYQVLIKIFLVAEGIAACKFESTQTWLECGSEERDEAQIGCLPNISEK